MHRILSALLLLVPVALAACTTDAEAEGVASSEGAISGSIAPGTELVTSGRVNFRAGSSQSSAILQTLDKGAIVTVLEGSPTRGYYRVSFEDAEGWVFGSYLVRTGATPAPGEDASAPNGSFNGRRFAGVTMLWQGNWDYLVRCDSYSRSRGRVVFYCDEAPSRSFVDTGAWIAMPRANFTRSMCGGSARVCKGEDCIVATIVEKSETTGKWEGSAAVLAALGAQTGFSGCSSSFGTATGVTVTLP